MAMFDPFYGVYGFGKDLSRWLNRILLIAELLAVAFGYWYHLTEVWMRGAIWWSIAYFPLCLVLISALNKLVRAFWNIIEVIVYGTTDADDIMERHEQKMQKRALRAQKRLLRRQEAAARRSLKAAGSKRHRPELYADKQQVFFLTDENSDKDEERHTDFHFSNPY